MDTRVRNGLTVYMKLTLYVLHYQTSNDNIIVIHNNYYCLFFCVEHSLLNRWMMLCVLLRMY